MDVNRKSISPKLKYPKIDLPDIDIKAQIIDQEKKSPYIPKRAKFHTLNYN
jgi:hypothetical protein